MEVIPYDLVATKMNFWYTSLKNNWIGKAEETKKEVKQLLDNMEENQDALIYYSLLEFRHKLQFDFLSASSGGSLEERFEKFREIRKKKKLEGMLDYYYHFFTGMYYFRQRELIHALDFYRKAELQLNSFRCDELEKAEYYYKASEVYYYMKQTFFSMNYANNAYRIYHDHESYGERRVQCQFILSGNLIDRMCHEKALDNLHNALDESNNLGSGHLIGSSHVNLGICYNELEEIDKSSDHLQKALKVYKEEKNPFELKALFNLAHVKIKQAELNKALDLYLEGIELARKYEKFDDFAKLELLKGLYFDYDMDLLRKSFKFFKEKGMYADMEEYSVLAAETLAEKEKVHDSIEFYRVSVEARRLIKRSGIIHHED
ncbi:Rap family tetratricopeptide repeat protein [Bacillus changyiensis]|uniref:Rap family tetratricopeptide repeat protein n=1 Tax=Bacillus changyiensis TaxID=3004103 RepID=UPI0022E64D43|nr:Rap family tetratricopeptide repeat protein [Bacillus changyiensis]MDA1474985.1 tetratricopeptide repeat protein [Bacillus changyiensis]